MSVATPALSPLNRALIIEAVRPEEHPSRALSFFPHGGSVLATGIAQGLSECLPARESPHGPRFCAKPDRNLAD